MYHRILRWNEQPEIIPPQIHIHIMKPRALRKAAEGAGVDRYFGSTTQPMTSFSIRKQFLYDGLCSQKENLFI